jgi:splicing suppressor protein 51
MADATTNCATCKKTGTETPNLKRCAKCKTTYYCSPDCQKADWKSHKKQCSAPGAADAIFPNIKVLEDAKLKNLEGTIGIMVPRGSRCS